MDIFLNLYRFIENIFQPFSIRTSEVHFCIIEALPWEEGFHLGDDLGIPSTLR